MAKISQAIFALLFPVPCQVCGQLVETPAQGVACRNCWYQVIPMPSSQSCQRCAYPYLEARADCPACRTLAFHYARACGPYQGALRASILHLKRYPTLSPHLSTLLAQTFVKDSVLTICDTIIPVPLHAQRERERGFNQAEVIARQLAARTGLPVDRDSLARVKATPMRRAGLDTIARHALTDAFRVMRPRLIKGAGVLIVDDVFTSGGTLSACASALLAAGASTVRALTLARTVGYY